MIMMMTVITGQFLVQCNNFCANNLKRLNLLLFSPVSISGNDDTPCKYLLYFSFDPLKDRSPQNKEIDFNVAIKT